MRHNGGLGSLFVVAAALLLAACASIGRPEGGPRDMTPPVMVSSTPAPGSVNVSNLVSVSCSDDSFDWTEGWNGTATNLVAYQEAEETLGYDCDCLIEADNNENNYAATPVAHPVLKNLILVGNNSAAGNRGIRLRRGTQVEKDGASVRQEERRHPGKRRDRKRPAGRYFQARQHDRRL